MKVVAAILAAGRSRRFGEDKTQILLHGKPVWQWSFDVFRQHPEVDEVGLVGNSVNLGSLKAANGACFVIEGGSDRRESSRRAVEAAVGAEVVLLHDAARPFVSPTLIHEVIAAVRRVGAAAPGLPITDTVKRLGPNGLETLDRSELFTMQTPQGAKREILQSAHRRFKGAVTDDLQLLEAVGVQPEIVPGDPANLKITRPEDIAVYREARPDVRTGMGYDVHAFSTDPSRSLMLGGVHFEGTPALEGHSDADVLLHAAVDALLGAAGLGDIGQHFPNDDARWKDAPSRHFLQHAGQLLKEAGWQVANLDVTVVAEQPKLMSRSDEIRRNIASALEIDAGRINVKATTNERLGFVGRGEGIAAMAIATISRF